MPAWTPSWEEVTARRDMHRGLQIGVSSALMEGEELRLDLFRYSFWRLRKRTPRL